MNVIMNRLERDKYLVHLIHQEYQQHQKEEQLYYQFYKWVRRVLGYKEALPAINTDGYCEDESAIRVYKIKESTTEIAAIESKNLIIQPHSMIRASVKANTLYVAGVVNGNVDAKYVFIKGKVVGNITAEYLEIFPKGYTEGTVETSNLFIHKKASLNGDCHIH